MYRKTPIGIVFRKFEEAMLADPPVGQYAYGLAMKWFNQFKKAAGMRQNTFNSKIDNSALLFRNELRRSLTVGDDYLIVTPVAWEILLSNYGGGPVVKIPILLDPVTGKGTPVPIPSKFTVYYEGQSMLFLVPNLITIGDLKRMLCKEVSVNTEMCRIRDFHGLNVRRVLDDNILIRDLNFPGNSRELLLEAQNADGTWKNVSDLRITTAIQPKRTFNPALPQAKKIERGEPGCCGLQNIGNTCFMNASLQCLSHVLPLINYFVTGEFTGDINTTNTFGAHGDIARAFGLLMKQLWSGDSSVVVPYGIKHVIGQFAPQFSGFLQQDAHEFITYILDGLHEDLNKVRQKAYYPEELIGDGTNDQDLARETLQRIDTQNVSRIMDSFRGLGRHQLRCPCCHNITVSFNSFTSLQVPLPFTTSNILTVTFIPYDRLEPPTIMSMEYTGITEDVESFICRNIGRETKIIFMFKPLGGDYCVSNPRPSNLGENFAFEVPDPSKKYCVLSLHSSVESAFSVKVSELAIPMLLELEDPMKPENLQHLCENRISGFWTPTEADAPDNAASVESKLKPNPAIKFKPNEKVQAMLTSALSPSSAAQNVMTPSVIAFMNCEHMKASAGFNWATFLITNGEEMHSANADQVQLIDCIREMHKMETLDENNKWFCPSCREFVQAEKMFSVWNLPNVLVLQLARFVQVGGVRRKYDINVVYPDVLDLSEFVSPGTGETRQFKLFGVVEHMGSISGGHYTAHCWHHAKEHWYAFNDSHAEPVNASMAHSPKAYVLFYQRV